MSVDQGTDTREQPVATTKEPHWFVKCLAEQALKLLAFGLPLALFALWGNSKLVHWQEVNTRQRDTYQQQVAKANANSAMLASLHTQLLEASQAYTHAIAYPPVKGLVPWSDTGITSFPHDNVREPLEAIWKAEDAVDSVLVRIGLYGRLDARKSHLDGLLSEIQDLQMQLSDYCAKRAVQDSLVRSVGAFVVSPPSPDVALVEHITLERRSESRQTRVEVYSDGSCLVKNSPAGSEQSPLLEQYSAAVNEVLMMLLDADYVPLAR